jgi:hypothetical protein
MARDMKGRMFKGVIAAALWMLGHAALAGTVTYVYTDPQGNAVGRGGRQLQHHGDVRLPAVWAQVRRSSNL